MPSTITDILTSKLPLADRILNLLPEGMVFQHCYVAELLAATKCPV
jgi:hypothetical protein